MTNHFRTLGAIALVVASLTSCNENDGPDGPVIDPVETTTGAIIINQGVYNANIAGSLTYIDFVTNQADQKVFENANGSTVLGDTPQSVFVYGSKMYVALYGSNLIRVLDVKNFKEIKRITPTASTGTQPRYFAADGTKVYVTMFDGYVARIDTTSLEIDASVKVGPNPDGIAVCNGYVYAANSDGMNYMEEYANGNTVSQIDIATFTEKQKINVGMNPGAMVATENDVFVIVRGNYGSIPSMLKKINSNGSLEEIGTATYVSATRNQVLYVHAPYGQPLETVSCYTPRDGSTQSITLSSPVEYPAAFEADEVSKTIIITGYNMSNGLADYMSVGFANLYDNTGKLINTYATGHNPCGITFKTLLQ